jgi:hypothetical protein
MSFLIKLRHLITFNSVYLRLCFKNPRLFLQLKDVLKVGKMILQLDDNSILIVMFPSAQTLAILKKFLKT